LAHLALAYPEVAESESLALVEEWEFLTALHCSICSPA